MDDKIQRFFEDIKGKKVAFCGIGRTNNPLVKLFIKNGADVTVCDRKDRGSVKKAADKLESLGAKLRLGSDYLKNLDADVIFRTPGMNYNMPELIEARKKGIVVTSEMEVFFDLCPARIFAVTGSDGKTTTTTLIYEMLKKQGYNVFLGGNIGKPLLNQIEDISKDDIAVVELSSFQLISMRRSPDIAVITNIAPNHLDVHKDMDEYINAKKNIILHQNAFSRTVLNLDNFITRNMIDEVRGETLTFSRLERSEAGACMDGDKLVFIDHDSCAHEVMQRSDIKLVGEHNVENYLAAVSAVWGYVSPENMRAVAREFNGVEHRMELIKVINGVKWYNDSIATNPTRTIAGLNSYNQKIILIAGGYDKHIPFDPLGPVVNERVKYLILMGVTAQKIEQVVKSDPNYDPEKLPIVHAKTMQEAVNLAKEAAVAGDIVSLSPACASFDMYKDFEARGIDFKNIVNSL